MGFLSALQQQPQRLQQQAPEKFSSIILKYLESLKAAGCESPQRRTLTIIARSPSSAVARALADQGDGFKGHRVTARVLLARFTPAPLMKDLIAILSELGGDERARSTVRWLKQPRLLDAHEQLVMGAEFCWTGDALRRSEDSRNGLDMFAVHAPETARLGARAFAALWKASSPAPLGDAAPLAENPLQASTAASAARPQALLAAFAPDLKTATRH